MFGFKGDAIMPYLWALAKRLEKRSVACKKNLTTEHTEYTENSWACHSEPLGDMTRLCFYKEKEGVKNLWMGAYRLE
jgi:hypothetical protein